MSKLDEALTDIISYLWKVLKATDIELVAYKKAISDYLQTNDPKAEEYLNECVSSHRRSSDLQAKNDEKYQRVLGTLLTKLPRNLSPTDPVSKRLRDIK